MKDNQYYHKRYRQIFNAGLDSYLKTGKENLWQYNINFKKIFETIGDCPGTRKEYHLDHVIPLSYFDFNVPEHFELCHRPENLRWLRARSNLVKNARFIPIVFTSNKTFNIYDLAVYFRKKYYNELNCLDTWMENWRSNSQ